MRRQQGQQFDFEQIRKISAWQENGKSGCTSTVPACSSPALTQTAGNGVHRPVRYRLRLDVEVSQRGQRSDFSWTGLPPRRLPYHTRRMFGGSLPHSWPLAAVQCIPWMVSRTAFERPVETSEVVLKESFRELKFLTPGADFRAAPTSSAEDGKRQLSCISTATGNGRGHCRPAGKRVADTAGE